MGRRMQTSANWGMQRVWHRGISLWSTLRFVVSLATIRHTFQFLQKAVKTKSVTSTLPVSSDPPTNQNASVQMTAQLLKSVKERRSAEPTESLIPPNVTWESRLAIRKSSLLWRLRENAVRNLNLAESSKTDFRRMSSYPMSIRRGVSWRSVCLFLQLPSKSPTICQNLWRKRGPVPFNLSSSIGFVSERSPDFRDAAGPLPLFTDGVPRFEHGPKTILLLEPGFLFFSRVGMVSRLSSYAYFLVPLWPSFSKLVALLSARAPSVPRVTTDIVSVRRASYRPTIRSVGPMGSSTRISASWTRFRVETREKSTCCHCFRSANSRMVRASRDGVTVSHLRFQMLVSATGSGLSVTRATKPASASVDQVSPDSNAITACHHSGESIWLLLVLFHVDVSSKSPRIFIISNISACGCSAFGSARSDCEQTTGKCECRNGALGDKCNQCPSGTIMTAGGCVTPADYKTPRSAKLIQFSSANGLQRLPLAPMLPRRQVCPIACKLSRLCVSAVVSYGSLGSSCQHDRLWIGWNNLLELVWAENVRLQASNRRCSGVDGHLWWRFVIGNFGEFVKGIQKTSKFSTVFKESR